MKYHFNKIKGLTLKVPASTLLEVIVAAIIFMIVFVMGMDTLTRIFIFNHKDNEELLIESSFSKCNRDIKTKELVMGDQTYIFDWGKIDINISHYKDKLFLVKMNALTNENREISYRYILTDPTIAP